MKKVSFVVDKYFQNNLLFDQNQKKIEIRDNALYKYYILYDTFKKAGFDIATNDLIPIEAADIIVYTDMPKKLPLKKNIHKSYLILMESPLIKKENYNLEKHECFNKIFTWDDTLVDNKKYIKFNYAFKIPSSIPKKLNKEKLCCLIVGNKNSDDPNELYSERKKAIRWFENNHPDDFSLYGTKWNEYIFEGPKILRALNRIPLVKQLMFYFFGEFYPSYRGKVRNKFEVMQQYKFAIAYENIKDQEGYITEKIFDCFFAGCVPIYLGANNITDYIPKECFIDKRDYDTYEDLYDCISNIDQTTYMNYVEHIEQFLNSEKANPFRAETFANIIVCEVLKR